MTSETETADVQPPREYGWVATVAGAVGLLASFILLLDHIAKLKDPNFVPACDLNPLVGCGQFLESTQAHAFGFPNVMIGLAAFPVVIACGLLVLGRVPLPRWWWRGMLVGTLFGMGFVTWLQFQAFFSIKGICLWCLSVWVVMIPLFVHTAVRALAAGALPASPGLVRQLDRNRWWIVAIWYLVVLVGFALTLGPALLATF